MPEPRIHRTARGFRYADFEDGRGPSGSVQESSAIGDYEDACDRPGSSYLWIGRDGNDDWPRLHLDREQVQDLVTLCQTWLATGRLPEPRDA